MSRKVKTKTGFAGKIEEIEVTVEDQDLDPWGADARLSVVGTSIPRVDGAVKVTGRAKYTFDIAPKNMLYAKILRSPHGAATIKSVDSTEAEKMAGVIAVEKRSATRVSFHGDEILAVAAESEEIAEEALSRIKVEYAVEPCVTTIEDARKPGAPRVLPNQDNIQKGQAGRPQGDPDGAIGRAHKVVEQTYTTEVQTHSSLETHGLIVSFDGDSLTAWVSTQGTFGARDGISNASKIGQGKVRVIAEHVGGGFGAKLGNGREMGLCVQLAKKTGRPVKLMLDRKGEHLNGGNRPSSIQQIKGGVTRDGMISGIKAAVWGTGGVSMGGGGVRFPSFYEFGGFASETTTVLTNAGENRAFRAPGCPQGFFGMESFLDELAAAVNVDPLEFRKKNCRQKIHLAEFDLAAEKFGWKERWKTKAGSDKGPRKRGAGMACSTWPNAGGPGSRVDVVVSPDGTVEVRNGAQDIGTGTRTVLAVIAAEELGLKVDQVTVRLGDTNLPPGPNSGGSTTASSIGPAARLAAFKAKRELLSKVGGDRKIEDLDIRDGQVLHKGKAIDVTFKQLCEKLGTAPIQVTGERFKNYDGFANAVAGVQMAEVDVDIETGQVRVVRVVAVQDAGRVVDRLTFESQVSGGVIQGVSYALFEERRLDPHLGVMLNPDFLNYKIAGAKDCPEIIAIAFDVANAKNNVGMMGLGEPPTIPTAAAIANAVANAIGVRVRSLPITPDKVLAALEGKK